MGYAVDDSALQGQRARDDEIARDEPCVAVERHVVAATGEQHFQVVVCRDLSQVSVPMTDTRTKPCGEHHENHQTGEEDIIRWQQSAATIDNGLAQVFRFGQLLRGSGNEEDDGHFEEER